MLTAVRHISFTSGKLSLEGILHLPEGHGRFPGVVICHPHPRYGGDMRNDVVGALAASLSNAGIAALRFNFRGVGGSEGAFDRGIGEAEDATEAVAFLALHDSIDPSRVGIAGYSFGAWIALEACAMNDEVQAVVSIACPMSAFRDFGVHELLQPKLLICGELDHDFPADQFRFLARRFDQPKEVELMYGADHFFGGREAELGGMAARFFARWLGDGPR